MGAYHCSINGLEFDMIFMETAAWALQILALLFVLIIGVMVAV